MMIGADIKLVSLGRYFMGFLRLFSVFLLFLFLGSCRFFSAKNKANHNFESFVASEITVDDVSRITLKNGLEIIIFPNDRIPVASQMIWYKTGENFGIKDKEAVTHFLEHAAFWGTKKYPKGYFSNFIHKIGAEENAYVTSFGIAFFQRFLSAYLEKMMMLEADRMKNVQFSNQKMESDRKIILQEILQEKKWNYEKQLFDKVNAVLLGKHVLNLNASGSVSEIKNVKLADLKKTYQQYFRPSNTIIIYTGDIDRNEILKLAVKNFGSIEDDRPALKGKETFSPSYSLQNHKFLLSKIKNNSNPLFIRAYKFPSIEEYMDELRAGYSKNFNEMARKKKAVELFYTSEVFGRFMSLKLTGYVYRKLTAAPSKAIWSGAEYNFAVKYGGKFNIYVFLPKAKNSSQAQKSLNELEDYVDRVMDDLVNNGISEKDLRQVKNHLAGEAIYAADDAVSISKYMASVEKDGLDFEEHSNWQGNINNVTREDFNRLARIVLKKNKHVTLHLVNVKSQKAVSFKMIKRERDQ
jgi:zinc protease